MLIALKKSNAVRNDELIYLLAGGAKEKLQRREHDVPDERADAVRRRAHHGPHRPPPPWNRRPWCSSADLDAGPGRARTGGQGLPSYSEGAAVTFTGWKITRY